MSPELKEIIRRANWKRVLILAVAGGAMMGLGLILGPLIVVVGTTPMMTRIVGMFVMGGGLIAIGIPFVVWAACQVVVGFSDRTTQRLATPIDNAVEVFAALQDYAPRATVGWSEHLQAQFNEEPAALRSA